VSRRGTRHQYRQHDHARMMARPLQWTIRIETAIGYELPA
jgi:hypothetical protein